MLVHFVNSYLAGLRFDTQHRARTHICKKTMYNHYMCLYAHICIYRFAISSVLRTQLCISAYSRVLCCVCYTSMGSSFPGCAVLLSSSVSVFC